MTEENNRYPPISDYALISDCNCMALVSRRGSIDWCCMPRVDSDSCFGRLLDWDRGGYFSITPAAKFTSEWRYLPGTLVLEITFRTASGIARLIDFLTVEGESAGESLRYDHVRILEGVEGEVECRIE